MSFQNITRIAREFGTTVSVVKKILAKEGYIDGSVPTAKAISEGVATLRPLTDDVYGRTHVARWDFDRVAKLIVSAGEGGKRGRGVWSFHSACEKLAKASGMLTDIPAFCRTKKPHEAACEFMYEYGQILLEDQRSGRLSATKMIWAEIQPILKWLKTTTVADAAKADEARRLIEAVLDWLRLPTNLDRRTREFRSPAYANIRAKRGPKPKNRNDGARGHHHQTFEQP